MSEDKKIDLIAHMSMGNLGLQSGIEQMEAYHDQLVDALILGTQQDLEELSTVSGYALGLLMVNKLPEDSFIGIFGTMLLRLAGYKRPGSDIEEWTNGNQD